MKLLIETSQRFDDYQPMLADLEPDLHGVTDAVARWCKATPGELNTRAAWWSLWLAKRNGTPVGVTVLFRTKATPDRVLWLGWTGVSPKHRRRGIGRVLFDFAAQQARGLGAHTLRLFVEQDAMAAQAMYRERGMTFQSTVMEFLAQHGEDPAVIEGDDCLVFDLRLQRVA